MASYTTPSVPYWIRHFVDTDWYHEFGLADLSIVGLPYTPAEA